MEIVSIDTGRATWLFPTEEFVPLGGTDGMAIIQKVVERYEFKNFPQNPTREEVDKNGLKFFTGIFEVDGKRAGVGEFGLYGDGIVAISNTTEHSEAFIEDIVGFAIDEFQFRNPVSPIKKIFVSTVTVEFENSLSNVLADQAALMSLVGSYLNAPQNTSYNVEVTRLDLSLDDSKVAASARPRLILESRQSVPLARKRYYSNAAIHTEAHLELLKQIEGMFMRPSTAGS
jgi:hypothetical protein